MRDTFSVMLWKKFLFKSNIIIIIIPCTRGKQISKTQFYSAMIEVVFLAANKSQWSNVHNDEYNKKSNLPPLCYVWCYVIIHLLNFR